MAEGQAAQFYVAMRDGRGLPATGLAVRAVGIGTGTIVLLAEKSVDGIPSGRYEDLASACLAEDQDIYEKVGDDWEYRSTERWGGQGNTPIARSKFFIATAGQNTYDLAETARGVPQTHIRNGLSMTAARSLWTLSGGRYVVLTAAYASQILAGDEMEFLYEV